LTDRIKPPKGGGVGAVKGSGLIIGMGYVFEDVRGAQAPVLAPGHVWAVGSAYFPGL
jgi:hypothetical protein